MSDATPDPRPPLEPQPRNGLGRWLPLAAVLIVMAAIFASGAHRALSLKTLGLNFEWLQAFIAEHRLAALFVYALIYVAVVALSLPGSLVLTLSGGLLFGALLAGSVTVLAATAGATLIFVIARTSLGDALTRRAGPALAALREGFQKDAFNYLLFARLVPAFPFFAVNLAAALLGMPLRTYVLATLIGIIPATFAFSSIGAGLGGAVATQNAAYRACLATAGTNGDAACPYRIDVSALVTPQLLGALAVLGALALLPILLKRLRARNG